MNTTIWTCHAVGLSSLLSALAGNSSVESQALPQPLLCMILLTGDFGYQIWYFLHAQLYLQPMVQPISPTLCICIMFGYWGPNPMQPSSAVHLEASLGACGLPQVIHMGSVCVTQLLDSSGLGCYIVVCISSRCLLGFFISLLRDLYCYILK